MINPLKPLTTPEYLFRPSQLCVRLRRFFQRPLPESDRVRLPWGQTITVRPSEVIGASIWWHGVFDLIVTEAIWRLLDAGETAIDIGANLGQMTSLMRCRTGARGRVISFEPHPALVHELAKVARETPPGLEWGAAEIHPCALSDHEGDALLDPGQAWEGNRGLAKLTSVSGRGLQVPVRMLDGVIPEGTQVGVCKIDVEGHELAVFKGATRLLSEHRIRDIVFEDFGQYPSPLQQYLLGHGFRLFSLHSTLWRPQLQPVLSADVHFGKEGMNFLATLEPERAVERFRSRGWRVLRNS